MVKTRPDLVSFRAILAALGDNTLKVVDVGPAVCRTGSSSMRIGFQNMIEQAFTLGGVFRPFSAPYDSKTKPSFWNGSVREDCRHFDEVTDRWKTLRVLPLRKP